MGYCSMHAPVYGDPHARCLSIYACSWGRHAPCRGGPWRHVASCHSFALMHTTCMQELEMWERAEAQLRALGRTQAADEVAQRIRGVSAHSLTHGHGPVSHALGCCRDPLRLATSLLLRWS